MLWASKVAQAGYFSRDRVPPSRAWQVHGKPTVSAFFSLLLYNIFITPSLEFSTLWQPPYNNSSRTSKALPLVTATGGASLCACAMFPVVPSLGNKNERRISKGGRNCLIGFSLWETMKAAQGEELRNSHNFLGIPKVTVQSRYTLRIHQQQQQHRCNSSTAAPVLQTLAFVAATVVLCSCVRAVLSTLGVQL